MSQDQFRHLTIEDCQTIATDQIRQFEAKQFTHRLDIARAKRQLEDTPNDVTLIQAIKNAESAIAIIDVAIEATQQEADQLSNSD